MLTNFEAITSSGLLAFSVIVLIGIAVLASVVAVYVLAYVLMGLTKLLTVMQMKMWQRNEEIEEDPDENKT